MAKKESYDFEMKKRYHDELVRFILQMHTKRKNRHNLKVACFPGHEALEIINVYDKLDIPRKNIVGIEADPNIARELKQKNLGIEIFKGFDYEFFEQTNKRFDIINLDYQTYLNKNIDYSLGLIFGRELAYDKFILCTNFLGKRETDNGNLYRDNLLSTAALTHIAKKSLEQVVSSNAEYILNNDEIELIRKKAGIDKKLSYKRDNGISNLLLTRAQNGISNLKFPKMLKDFGLKHFTYAAELFREIENAKTLREQYNLIFQQEALKISSSWIEYYKIRCQNIAKDPLFAIFLFTFVTSFHAQQLASYHPFTWRRGKYINDKGSPMFYDFAYLKKAVSSSENIVKDIIQYDTITQDLIFDIPNDLKTIKKILDEFVKKECSLDAENIIQGIFPERKYLGSSYVKKTEDPSGDKNNDSKLMHTQKEKEHITELQAREYLLDFTPAEIALCYSGIPFSRLKELEIELLTELDKKESSQQTTTNPNFNAENAFSHLSQLRQSNPNEKITGKLVRTHFDVSLQDYELRGYIGRFTAMENKNGKERQL